jgi:hypothetical protein
MRSHKDSLKFAAALIVLTISMHAYANEEAASSGPAGSGFIARMTKISALKRETEDLEEQIKHLIEEKRESHDEKAVRTMTVEIAEKYRALETASEKLEAETVQVRFHYPEQAEKIDRKYVRFKKKSMKELESEAGIDGKLDRIRERVLATFPVPEIEKAKTEAPKISPLVVRQPASVEDSDVPEKIVLKK